MQICIIYGGTYVTIFSSTGTPLHKRDGVGSQPFSGSRHGRSYVFTIYQICSQFMGECLLLDRVKTYSGPRSGRQLAYFRYSSSAVVMWKTES